MVEKPVPSPLGNCLFYHNVSLNSGAAVRLRLIAANEECRCADCYSDCTCVWLFNVALVLVS